MAAKSILTKSTKAPPLHFLRSPATRSVPAVHIAAPKPPLLDESAARLLLLLQRRLQLLHGAGDQDQYFYSASCPGTSGKGTRSLWAAPRSPAGPFLFSDDNGANEDDEAVEQEEDSDEAENNDDENGDEEESNTQ